MIVTSRVVTIQMPANLSRMRPLFRVASLSKCPSKCHAQLHACAVVCVVSETTQFREPRGPCSARDTDSPGPSPLSFLGFSIYILRNTNIEECHLEVVVDIFVPHVVYCVAGHPCSWIHTNLHTHVHTHITEAHEF